MRELRQTESFHFLRQRLHQAAKHLREVLRLHLGVQLLWGERRVSRRGFQFTITGEKVTSKQHLGKSHFFLEHEELITLIPKLENKILFDLDKLMDICPLLSSGFALSNRKLSPHLFLYQGN